METSFLNVCIYVYDYHSGTIIANISVGAEVHMCNAGEPKHKDKNSMHALYDGVPFREVVVIQEAMFTVTEVMVPRNLKSGNIGRRFVDSGLTDLSAGTPFSNTGHQREWSAEQHVICYR